MDDPTDEAPTGCSIIKLRNSFLVTYLKDGYIQRSVHYPFKSREAMGEAKKKAIAEARRQLPPEVEIFSGKE